MPEAVINLHMHTIHSDGTGTHEDIARAALDADLDAVLVSDHNLLVPDQEGYIHQDGKSLLMLVGEEIHDPQVPAENNHLLVFGVDREMAQLSGDTQALINAVAEAGGLSFLAHPIDLAAPRFGERSYSWDQWDVEGYTGIELWNGFSEYKERLTGVPQALWYAYFPRRMARGPHPEAIKLWDRLTSGCNQVVAVGGSDAHAMNASLGPIKRVLFPYEYHFRAVNSHLVLDQPLSGELENDRDLIYNALRRGRVFIGYDLPHSTSGFQFFAAGSREKYQMGEKISLEKPLQLHIKLPRPASLRLIRNGEQQQSWRRIQTCQFEIQKPGVYRVEAYLPYLGRRRTWIISNPIYIKE